MSEQSAAPPREGQRRESRQTHVIETLRAWALNGTLRPDEKLSESALATALGVSRTPVRHALAVLVEEGVLQRAGARGYRVRNYKVADVIQAIELRSLVEGYAARKLALTGASDTVLAGLKDCLNEGDRIFLDGGGETVDEQRYSTMNLKFHLTITRAAEVILIEQIRNLIDRIPFGAPDAIRFERFGKKDRFSQLQHAHWQHHYIVTAIMAGDGARAEALFREHGELIKVSLGLAKGLSVPAGGRILPIIDPGEPASTIASGRSSKPHR